MALTKATAAKDTTIEITGTTTAPFNVQEVIEITPVPMEREQIDVTFHSSSLFRNTIPGLFVLSQLEFRANYVKTEFTTLQTIVTTAIPELLTCVITYPDASTLTFQGNLTRLDLESPIDAQLIYNATITIKDVITWA